MRKRSLLYQEGQSFGRIFIQPLCNSYGSVVKKGLSHLTGEELGEDQRKGSPVLVTRPQFAQCQR